MDSATLENAPLNAETNIDRSVLCFTKTREAVDKEAYKLGCKRKTTENSAHKMTRETMCKTWWKFFSKHQDAGAMDKQPLGPDTKQQIVETIDNNTEIELNITYDDNIQ